MFHQLLSAAGMVRKLAAEKQALTSAVENMAAACADTETLRDEVCGCTCVCVRAAWLWSTVF